MKRIIAFIILGSIKTFSHIFFRGRFRWITEHPKDPFHPAKLFVFLNHTSLFEPIYIQAVSYRYIWYLTAKLNVPGADITLNRPIVGRFWKLMMPNIASVSRKKDSSWENYLKSIRPDSVIMIAAEGRMKRPNGLDKYGKAMTVRGGVADIIEELEDGGIILAFSGGLHHIQAPGQTLPRLFRPIAMNLAYLDIKEYKSRFPGSSRERKLAIVQDLQRRLETDCPTVTWSRSKSSLRDEGGEPVKAKDAPSR